MLVRRLAAFVLAATSLAATGATWLADSPAGAGTGPIGYYEVASDGGVFTFGAVSFYGSMGGRSLNKPIVGMATTADGRGYWLVASDGGIFTFGDAVFYGSTGAIRLNQPIVGMARTNDGGGYWLVASDGGIFTFGDAVFYGSTGAIRLSQPIVGMASTPDGRGYWLVARDGGIFTFGNASFNGSGVCTTQCSPVAPVVGLGADGDSNGGYWITSNDGTTGYFPNNPANFQADFFGPGTAIPGLVQPIVGIAAAATVGGYYLVAADGGIFTFGTAPFYGSIGGHPLNKPVVGMAEVG